MNRQSLRSICARAGPEIHRTGCALQNYFREFSTSQWVLESNDSPSDSNPSASSARQRSRAAASEISSLAKQKNPSGTSQNSALPTAAPTTAQPRVLDVRSLPRGRGTRGRGRGGGAFRGGRGQGQIGTAHQSQSPGAQSPPLTSGNRFSRPGVAGRGSFTARGSRGRGGRGRGASSRGGRAGRGRRFSRSDAPDGGDDKDKRQLDKKNESAELMDVYEAQFDRDMRFGTTSSYQPSLTLDALADFAPAVPSGAMGRHASILASLSALGPTDPIGMPQDLPASSYAADLERAGLRFFADSKSRDAAEQFLQQKQQQQQQQEAKTAADGQDNSSSSSSSNNLLDNKTEGGAAVTRIQDAEESVRQVILDQAVEGKHEKMTFATAPVGLARAWHLRAETWTKQDVDTFEKKLTSLVDRGAKRIAGGPP